MRLSRGALNTQSHPWQGLNPARMRKGIEAGDISTPASQRSA